MGPALGDDSRPGVLRRGLSWCALVLGGCFALLGLALIGAYVFGAVVDRIGDPDQSLLFWYLPFLLGGVMAMFAGGAVAVLGYLGLRKVI